MWLINRLKCSARNFTILFFHVFYFFIKPRSCACSDAKCYVQNWLNGNEMVIYASIPHRKIWYANYKLITAIKCNIVTLNSEQNATVTLDSNANQVNLKHITSIKVDIWTVILVSSPAMAVYLLDWTKERFWNLFNPILR